jgi:hypothetical protein
MQVRCCLDLAQWANWAAGFPRFTSEGARPARLFKVLDLGSPHRADAVNHDFRG